MGVRVIETGTMRFEGAFAASDWKFSNFAYSLNVPLLGGTTAASSRLQVEEVDVDGVRALRLLHTCGDGHETDILITVPADAVALDKKPYLQNPVGLHLKHVLHGRWWPTVVAMCKSARDGDFDAFTSAWRDLRSTCVARHASMHDALLESTPLDGDTVAAVMDAVIFGEPGWSQSACRYALNHAHDALGRGVRGAAAILARILADGDLTRDVVLQMCCGGLSAKIEDPTGDWIVCKSSSSFFVYMHRSVFERFGIVADDFKAEFFGYLPIAFS